LPALTTYSDQLRERLAQEEEQKRRKIAELQTPRENDPSPILANVLKGLGYEEVIRSALSKVPVVGNLIADQIFAPLNAFSMGTNTLKGYHGTKKPIEGQFRGDLEVSMPDRMIGPHFSKSPQIANKFTEERMGYGQFGKTAEGGAVYPIEIQTEGIRRIPQPTYPNGAKMADQHAIGADIARVVFPERPDLFKEWVKRSRNVDDTTAQNIYNALKEGRDVTEDIGGQVASHEGKTAKKWGWKKVDFGSYQADYDAGFHMVRDLLPDIVTEYKNILKRQGVDVLKYENTSPMETAGIKKKESFIAIEPDKVTPPWMNR
jgi:hypothetical protein